MCVGHSCYTKCVYGTCNYLYVVLSVRDWNSYKRIHGNIYSTPIHQSVVSCTAPSILIVLL